MDRAGYCFGSTLGKAVFDNTGCAGKSVTLSTREQRLVQRLQDQEKLLECSVNTKGTKLYVPDLAFRWELRDLPVADEHESGCIGWQVAPTPLYAGRDISSPVVSTIRPGDDVLFSHWSEGDWNYVIIQEGGWGRVKGAGWLIDKTDESTCRQWAG